MSVPLFEKLSSWVGRHKPFALALFIGAGVVAVYVISFRNAAYSDDPADWGQFGDYFGGLLNPIVAGIALFLLAVSVDIQRKELRETKSALESQAKSLARQVFEGTFFGLLGRFESVRQDISEPSPSQGKAAIKGLVNWVGTTEFQKQKHEVQLERALGAYSKTYSRYESSLGPYFRTLYHVFKFIEFSELLDEEKVRYANIARAALSTDDLFLLFYNGLTDEGRCFKPLIEKYGLLKHVNKEKLIHGQDVGAYTERAFLGAEARTGKPGIS